jgi:hypothetical protein
MKELPPPQALAPFVDRFWYRATADAPPSAEHRVLPDGSLDIVLGPGEAFVVGAMTRPLLLPPLAGAGLLGARFRPGMATAFLGLPAAALTDDRAPLEAIWRDGAEVADYVGSARGPEEAIARLTETLTSRLPRVGRVPPDLRAAVDRITGRGGRVDVSRPSRWVSPASTSPAGLPPTSASPRSSSAAPSGSGKCCAPSAAARCAGHAWPPTSATATNRISSPSSGASPASRPAAGLPNPRRIPPPVPNLQAAASRPP